MQLGIHKLQGIPLNAKFIVRQCQQQYSWEEISPRVSAGLAVKSEKSSKPLGPLS